MALGDAALVLLAFHYSGKPTSEGYYYTYWAQRWLMHALALAFMIAYLYLRRRELQRLRFPASYLYWAGLVLAVIAVRYVTPGAAAVAVRYAEQGAALLVAGVGWCVWAVTEER